MSAQSPFPPRFRRPKEPTPRNFNIELWKNLSQIVSAVAIPLVLAYYGSSLQAEQAQNGLKKDYVSIAASILKDVDYSRDPELRQWAVSVLDENAPQPFSRTAKESLARGRVTVIGSLEWVPPDDECKARPAQRTVMDEIARFIRDSEKGGLTLQQERERLFEFMRLVLKQEHAVGTDLLRFTCLLDSVDAYEKADAKYRKEAGLHPSDLEIQRARERLEGASAALKGSLTSPPSMGFSSKPQ